MLRILVAGGDGQLGQEFAGLSLPDVELVRGGRIEHQVAIKLPELSLIGVMYGQPLS